MQSVHVCTAEDIEVLCPVMNTYITVVIYTLQDIYGVPTVCHLHRQISHYSVGRYVPSVNILSLLHSAFRSTPLNPPPHSPPLCL